MRLAIIISLVLCALAAAVIWHGPLIAWFTGRPLGLSLSGSDGEDDSARIPAGPFTLTVTTQPAQLHAGENALAIEVDDAQGPVAGSQVTVEAEMGGRGAMAGMRAAATVAETGRGAYRGVLALPMPGTWMLRLGVATGDGRTGSASLPVSTGSTLAMVSGPAPKGIAYYTCSMHPSVRSATPGQCPICGMDLTPVTYAEVDSGVIIADAQRQQLIGVVTARVERRSTVTEIRADGVVAYAEPSLREITLRYPVWIGEVFASSLGISVTTGQPLFTVSSPDLLAAENEYVQSRRTAQGDKGLEQATFARLELWGLSSGQIDALASRTTVPPYTPILATSDGVVIEKNILPGGALEAGKVALRTADLSVVWVEAAVYEYEEGAIRVGMPVDVDLTAFPGEHWTGTIGFIYPFMDAQSRTTRVRIEVPNADRRLKPGMYAMAHLRIPLGERVVAPEDAVIHAGDTELVFIDLGGGRFKPQQVTTGLTTTDGVEIRDGLKPGDVVVTRATFLLAAESRLKSGAATW